jgi:hypothetical protein
MKLTKLFMFSFMFMILSTGFSNAQNTLYGLGNQGQDGESSLYGINQTTGQAQRIGPTGFERCGGMDYDPVSERLVAACQRHDGSDIGVLVHINTSTGQGTEINTLGCEISTDISFRNADNWLFGALFDDEQVDICNLGLYTINPAAGNSNFLGPFNANECCGNGMAFSSNDVLYLIVGDFGPPNTLYTVNQTTGNATPATGVTYPDNLDETARANAMEFDPIHGTAFISIVTGSGTGGTRENFIGTINISNGIVEVRGRTADGIDALAFAPHFSRPIPTLSEYGMIISAIALLAGALFFLRRRYTTA